MPVTRPTTAEPRASRLAQPAVMPTSPARGAFRHMPTSGLPFLIQVNSIQATVATAGAMVVLPRIWASWAVSDAAAPLKPYQQNHRMKVPMAARGMLWPRMARDLPFPSYLPMRAPSRTAPISPEMPPTMWMTADPAKSMKPIRASQPWAFHTQPASMG